MKVEQEVQTVKVMLNQKQIMVSTNEDVTGIVFHPDKNIMYIQIKGKWIKLKYEGIAI